MAPSKEAVDFQFMVEMAKEREGWRADGSSIAVHDPATNTKGFVAEVLYRRDAPFVALAPRAILAQAEQITDLRAEVEALRARVVRQEDSALVWEYIKEHGGKMEQAHGLNIHLWHHKSRWGNMEFVDIMRTRGSTFSSGSPDAIAKAAEWVRSQSE